jgi:hypothetical protein
MLLTHLHPQSAKHQVPQRQPRIYILNGNSLIREPCANVNKTGNNFYCRPEKYKIHMDRMWLDNRRRLISAYFETNALPNRRQISSNIRQQMDMHTSRASERSNQMGLGSQVFCRKSSRIKENGDRWSVSILHSN